LIAREGVCAVVISGKMIAMIPNAIALSVILFIAFSPLLLNQSVAVYRSSFKEMVRLFTRLA
jgi:hypothetical protein